MTLTLLFMSNALLKTLDQLEYVIGFIYAKEAVRSKEKESFLNCLKKILQQTNVFTETELELLFT